MQQLFVDSSWLKFFQAEYEQPYFKKLLSDIKTQYQQFRCFPEWKNIFSAFKACPLSEIKVVILGQDPYHQPNQAHGLAFSVLPGVTIPPSLKNIYQELQQDLNVTNNSGYLLSWAKQGVFLLNASLTVRYNQANSHKDLGWHTFTDHVLKYLSEQQEHLVFILWGNNARSKKNLIDQSKHLIIENVHPSPLSAYHGFFGSKPFSQTNNWLENKGLKKIDWLII